MGAGVDRLVEFDDSGVEMPEAEFRHAQIHEPIRDFGIARTEPHRLLRIGLRLFESAEDNFGECPRVEQRSANSD